jgi:hypothetical protein
MKNLLIFSMIMLSLSISAQEELDSFIAMEYRGMSNLIYKVYIMKDRLVGVKVNGYISVQNSMSIGYVVPKHLLNDPNAYASEEFEYKYRSVNLGDDTVLSMDDENFILLKSQIKSIEHSKKKKFGIGYYPYSGRIIIETEITPATKRKERDLILVGNQDWEKILRQLK